MATSALSRFGMLHGLRILYLLALVGGIFMILTLNNKLNAKSVENEDFLIALFSKYPREIDPSCIAMIARNTDAMRRIRHRFRQFPTHYVAEILEEELHTCKSTPQLPRQIQKVSPNCKMRGELFRLGPKIDLKSSPPPTLMEIENKYRHIMEEGFYPGPSECHQHSTLFILPYRDREIHLRYWLNYTIDTLILQKLRFQIIVVEQEEEGVFNKGQIMNTAFVWATENLKYRWDCVVFHDVDMISELYGTLFQCKGNDSVIHFARYIDKFDYVEKGMVTVGGAVGFTVHQYRLVNGYSNVYWGWGGEDDDMYERLKKMSLKLIRYKQPYGRYKMIHHVRDKGNPTNPVRFQLLQGASSRMLEDGLSSLDTKILQVDRQNVYIRLLVRVNKNNTITLPLNMPKPTPSNTMPDVNAYVKPQDL